MELSGITGVAFAAYHSLVVRQENERTSTSNENAAIYAGFACVQGFAAVCTEF